MSTYARAAARASRRPAIRWDRLTRVFLLVVLFAILMLYISPLQRWFTQHNTAQQDSAQLHELQAHNQELRAKLKALRQPQALEMRARQLGMVGRGERAFVIENLPR